MSFPTLTGAYVIARTLRDLGVTVVFGIVGVPVSDIAEQATNLGIRFIGFRNEQAASYAATAYGYLTGRPGVCLVVGGPGVLHAIAGVGTLCFDTFNILRSVYVEPPNYSFLLLNDRKNIISSIISFTLFLFLSFSPLLIESAVLKTQRSETLKRIIIPFFFSVVP
jgi:hypothetical protein